MSKTETGAMRFDTNKIELHHIHPKIWLDGMKHRKVNKALRSLSNDMDLWFYYRDNTELSDLVVTSVQTELEQLCQVLTFGAKKYASLNYVKGMKYSRVLNSFRRHLLAIANGEKLDPESGLPHTGHLYCNILFAKTYVVLGYDGGEFDDRPDLEVK